MVRRSTQVMIEGFPRSANTFAVVAFQITNSSISVAHHLHNLAQLAGARLYRTPSIVLFRNPFDSILSQHVFFGEADDLELAEEWIRYYRYVLRHQDDFLLADFELVTNDYDEIIRRLNQRFNTDFSLPEINLNRAEIGRRIKHLSATSNSAYEVRVRRFPLPSAEKERLRRDVEMLLPAAIQEELGSIFRQLREAAANFSYH